MRHHDDLRFELTLHVAASIVLIAVSWLLVRGLNTAPHQSSSSPPVAFVTETINTTRTRPAKIPFWQDAAQGTPLYERDQVFTSPKSSAAVEFVSGQKIQLEESSLVVIELESQSPALNIRRGIVYIVSGANARGDVAFRVNGVKGRVRAGESKAVVDVARDGTASVYVLSGGATLESPQGPVEVIARHVSQVSQSGVVAEAEAARVMLESPAWDSAFLLEPETPVAFSWSLQGQLDDVHLELATDSHFESIYRRVPVQGQTVTLSGLRPGKWYWRVVGTSRGVGYKSDTRQINFTELAPPRILVPSPNELFTLRDGKSRVTIDWLPPALKAAAEFELSRGDDPPRIIRADRPPHIMDQSSSFDAGVWSIRGRSVFPAGQTSSWSSPVAFSVGEEAKPVPPQLVAPPDGARLPFAEVLLKGTGPKVMNLVFEVSRGENFTGDVIRLSENALKARFQPPEAGVWWWRASGEDFLGRTLPLSEPRKMEFTTRKTLAPPRLKDQDLQINPQDPRQDDDATSPPSGAFLMPVERSWTETLLHWIAPVAWANEARNTRASPPVGSVTVRWPAVEGAAGYQVQIAAQKDFVALEHDERTRESQWTWSEARAGVWWYRVAVWDGDELSEFSEPAQLRVTPPPPVIAAKPAPIPPVVAAKPQPVPSKPARNPTPTPAQKPAPNDTVEAPPATPVPTLATAPPSPVETPKPPVPAASLVLLQAGSSWLDASWETEDVTRRIEGRIDNHLGLLAQVWWRRTLRVAITAQQLNANLAKYSAMRAEFGPTWELSRDFWWGPVVQGEQTLVTGFPREQGTTIVDQEQIALWRVGMFWHRKAGRWHHMGSLAYGQIMPPAVWGARSKPSPALDLALLHQIPRRWLLGLSTSASSIELYDVTWREEQKPAVLRQKRIDVALNVGVGF